jgi:hypothetical protein
MTIQLPLPGVAGGPRNASWPDAEERLQEIEKDKVQAKYEIRQVLDRVADKHGIRAKDVNHLVWGYVDDMLSDLFYEKEGELTREIEEDIEREGQRP